MKLITYYNQTWSTTISSLCSMTIAASWPWSVPRVSCCAGVGITSCMFWGYRIYASSTSSYYQKQVASSHYKGSATAPRTFAIIVNSSFLANKYLNDLIFRKAESPDHSCTSSSVLRSISVSIVPPCCSYCFYSIITSVRHSPLLNAAGQCNLSVMILTCVVTTKCCRTISSTGIEIRKDRTES